MEAPTPRTCPPHYWLIDGANAAQRWTCRRCGAQRQGQDATDEAISAQWRSFRGGARRTPKAADGPATPSGG